MTPEVVLLFPCAAAKTYLWAFWNLFWWVHNKGTHFLLQLQGNKTKPWILRILGASILLSFFFFAFSQTYSFFPVLELALSVRPKHWMLFLPSVWICSGWTWTILLFILLSHVFIVGLKMSDVGLIYFFVTQIYYFIHCSVSYEVKRKHIQLYPCSAVL
jgi:hypothetical protein